MAKKNSSGGIIIVGLIILGLMAKYWYIFVSIGVVAAIIWFVAKLLKSPLQHRTSAYTEVNKSPSLSPSTLNNSPEELTAIQDRSSIQNPTFKIAVTTNYGTNIQQTKSVPPDSVWVPQGRAVEKDGYSINGGLIYFGSGLRNISGWGPEPALVDPSFPIDKNNIDREGRNMNYWPSYAQMHPTSRAAYLQWLATGKKDPNAYIGYVFLYFYGLERRALADVKDSASARAEEDTILSEAKRLLSIYGNNGSFRGYASQFIDILQATGVKDGLYKKPPTYSLPCYEIPFSVKAALGQLAADGVPLPPDWALAWVKTDPMTPLRTPAQRCKEEFQKLFRIRYAEKFGEGYKLKMNKTKLKISYRPASASFGGQIETSLSDLYDVTVLKEPISALRTLVEACTNELDAYSRYLGRNAGAGDSIEATAFLPTCLLSEYNGKEFRNLIDWLKNVIVSEAPVQVDFSELLQRIPSIGQQGIGKREAMAIAQILSKMGFGIEPDPRFGNLLPKPGEVVMLFKISESAPNFPSPESVAATVLIHLASAVATTDGTVTQEEERHLEEHLETWLHLSADERARLKAHTQWLLASFPGMNGIKKRIEGLQQGQKESIAKFLVSVAQSDGYIDPTEIKILTKIYGLLGLDAQNLYSHAHAAAVEPVIVQTADIMKTGYAVPAPSQPTEVVSLDMSSIEAKLAETVAVSAILNNIFTDDEPLTVQPATVKAVPDLKVVAGLDSESFAFMCILATKLSWAREELEQLATEKNLMLDGTLDSINDASFDHFGGPFFEGDDPIEIYPEIAKEIAV